VLLHPWVKDFLKNSSLSIVTLLLFVLFLGAQSFTGWWHYNDEQRQHQEPTVSFGEYTTSGEFWEATFENWESEFFQMSAFMLLSAFLIQRGAAESKKPKEEEEDEGKQPVTKDSPWPARVGGLPLKLYSHSMSISFGLLFLFSFIMHGVSGAAMHNEEALAHGEEKISLLAFMGSSEFWFQSFQNWQSEFLAVGALVLFSIVLREKGSPESKPVQAPHAQTGNS
jgi:hypothetical protein